MMERETPTLKNDFPGVMRHGETLALVFGNAITSAHQSHSIIRIDLSYSRKAHDL